MSQYQQQLQQQLQNQQESTPPRLRAEAPSFSFSQSSQAFAVQADSSSQDVSQYGDYGELHGQKEAAWKIVDPKNGMPIELDGLRPELDFVPPKSGGHKPLAIIDPNSGNTVNPLGLNFTPPKEAKPFTIIDPNSGDKIKV